MHVQLQSLDVLYQRWKMAFNILNCNLYFDPLPVYILHKMVE